MFGRGYVRRILDDELDELFPHLPAILIDGPKGVGKTETALQRCHTIRRLDAPLDRAVVEADPMIIADDTPPVLLDEWHRVPSVWDSVRRLVDQNPIGGRFLMTGFTADIGNPFRRGADRERSYASAHAHREGCVGPFGIPSGPVRWWPAFAQREIITAPLRLRRRDHR